MAHIAVTAITQSCSVPDASDPAVRCLQRHWHALGSIPHFNHAL